MLKDYINNIINDAGLYKNIKNYNIEYYNFFKELLTRHPCYFESTEDIKDIKILNNDELLHLFSFQTPIYKKLI